ncbi:MAG: T9SS type A sorting domain-containing protein [Bacteroidia bacterium]
MLGTSASIKFGYTTSGRPAVLSFSSKYTPIAGDSAFVAAYLTHYNTSLSKRDTIARGQYATGTASASYSINSLTMVYDPAFSSVWADTMLVFGSSSIYKHAGAKVGSVFYLDGLTWSGYNNVNEIDNKGSVSVYPNPAVNNVTFSSTENASAVQIMDITGRAIGNYTMTGNKLTVGTTGFAPGIYIYNVVNEKQQVINRGRFEVSK